MAWPNRFIGDKTAKNRPRILSLMRNCELEKTRQKPTSGLLKSKKKPLSRSGPLHLRGSKSRVATATEQSLANNSRRAELNRAPVRMINVPVPCALDDRFDISELRLPIKLSFGFFRGRNEARRITRPPWLLNSRNWMA